MKSREEEMNEEEWNKYRVRRIRNDWIVIVILVIAATVGPYIVFRIIEAFF